MTRAARERIEMDAAREAGKRARELHSLANMAMCRATALHLGSLGKLQEFKAKTCKENR